MGPSKLGCTVSGTTPVGDEPRTRSVRAMPGGNATPPGSGIEKLPFASLSPVAITCEPDVVAPKIVVFAVVAAAGGGSTSIARLLPSVPSGCCNVPRMVPGSGTDG